MCTTTPHRVAWLTPGLLIFPHVKRAGPHRMPGITLGVFPLHFGYCTPLQGEFQSLANKSRASRIQCLRHLIHLRQQRFINSHLDSFHHISPHPSVESGTYCTPYPIAGQLSLWPGTSCTAPSARSGEGPNLRQVLGGCKSPARGAGLGGDPA